ncbi:MAG: hypothetical protein GXO73_07820 [Calditrichaeota bacterium]|nr:hypothetical protein [Calditrichota bacterium]
MATRDIETYADDIQAHLAWLNGFEPARRRQWERTLKNDPEAAIVEACSRKLLAPHSASIVPAEDLACGGPDFLCRQEASHFYVEVTCLHRNTVTRATSLPATPTGRSQHYRDLTWASFNKCIKKASQCADLDASCLLIIGTLHYQGGCLCFGKTHLEEALTGEGKLAGRVNTQTGQAIGEPYQITALEGAAFLKPDELLRSPYVLARKSIAGVLFCGFGSVEPKVNGIIHPQAAHPFDTRLLPTISFGKLMLERSGTLLRVVWD